MEDSKRQLSVIEFIERNEITHASYDPEQEFYTAVRHGDLRKVEELCSVSLHEKVGLGELSKNPLQNIKYHFAITAALVARYCIDGGMEMAVAFSLSDFYINKADRMTNIQKISLLHKDMCLTYCQRMRELRRQENLSRQIVKAIDYIYDHLNTRITIKELADYVKLSEGHFSRLFKKELSQNVSDFIIERKIDTAKNMLVSSDYTLAEIAFTLAFPSQSYFTEVFKKRAGLTPREYRNKMQTASPFAEE